jgi:hypothetical protein
MDPWGTAAPRAGRGRSGKPRGVRITAVLAPVMVGAPGLNALRTVSGACAQVITVACRARTAPRGICWASVTMAWRSPGIFMESWAPWCTAAGVMRRSGASTRAWPSLSSIRRCCARRAWPSSGSRGCVLSSPPIHHVTVHRRLTQQSHNRRCWVSQQDAERQPCLRWLRARVIEARPLAHPAPMPLDDGHAALPRRLSP